MKWSTVAALAAASATWVHAADWTRVTTQNFELYTSAGDKAARDFALHFEDVRSFFSQASPVKPPGDFPLRIVVFSGSEEFRPYAPNKLAAAFFQSGPSGDYIVIRDASPESKAIAIHEYMHFVVRHSGLRIPLWLSEGWADVYSSMRRVKDGMAVGDLISGRMRILDSSRGAWFTFEALSSIGDKSPEYNEGNRTGLFYAESWALTHMLFLSPDYSPNFGKFLMALHRGSSTEEACRIAFNKLPQQVIADLTNYFDRKKLVGSVFETLPEKAGAEPAAAPVEEFQAKLMLADIQIAMGRVDLARIEYERLETQQPKRADLQRSLGFLFWSLKDLRKAREHMANAFAQGETDPKMCYLLGVLQMASGAPVAEITPPLERAVARSPGYADALLQLGVVWSLARQFDKAADALLAIPTITSEKAFGVFNALAYASLETGNVAEARTHLGTAGKYAKTDVEKKAHDELARLLEARVASPFPPRPGEQLVRTEATVLGVDCSPQGQKLRFSTSAEPSMVIDLPPSGAVEFMHKGEGTFKLSCGPAQQPVKVVLEYARSSSMRQGSYGVLRTLQF